MHLDLNDAIATAGLATAAFHIETETARLVAAQPSLRGLAEQFADRIKQAGIGCRIGAWRSPDRRLVDINNLVDMLCAPDPRMRTGPCMRAVNLLRQCLKQYFVDQRTFAGARYSGYGRKYAKRETHVNMLQIIFGRPQNFNPLAIGLAAAFRHRNGQLS